MILRIFIVMMMAWVISPSYAGSPVSYDPEGLGSGAGLASGYISLRGGGVFLLDDSPAYKDTMQMVGGALGLRVSFGRSRHVPLAAVRLETEGVYIFGDSQTTNNIRHKGSDGFQILASVFMDLRTGHGIKPYLVLSGGYRAYDLARTEMNMPTVTKKYDTRLFGVGLGVGFAFDDDATAIFDIDYRYLHAFEEDMLGNGHQVMAGIRLTGQ